MNRANSATGWVRDPIMKSPELDPTQASSYELGWTWNPITGCLNHVNGLCKGGGFPCYAYKLANGRLKKRYCDGTVLARNERSLYSPDRENQYDDPFYPRLWKKRLLDIPHNWRTLSGWQNVKSRGIFVCDMGELFGDWVPERWQEDIFNTIRQCPQYRFYLLTKQPQNLFQFSPFPENRWVGITATSSEMFIHGLEQLSRIDATVRYVSLEPLLSWKPVISGIWRVLDWLIIGAQTKPIVFPKIEWVQEIVEAADKAGIPVFLKDNLRPLPGDNLRQEIPVRERS